MISLESPRWSELQHAYGAASDIPALLSELNSYPSEGPTSEPWFTLWSSLAHQGDVYSASFAAVPHIIQLLEANPLKATLSFFHLPVWIEVCRNETSFEIPAALVLDYRQALDKLPALISAASEREWDSDFVRTAMAAIAVAKGFPVIAAAAMELTPEISRTFLDKYVLNE